MKRIFQKSLEKRWGNTSGLIQVILGPRQVGKTTAITELMATESPDSFLYAAADLPLTPTPEFIIESWKKVRKINSQSRVLIFDEIQKIPRWSEVVKALWDEDRRNNFRLDIWILGSSAILLDKGLAESLTGRFELNFFPHWFYSECRDAFGISLEEYVRFGGYPKVYSLKNDEIRAMDYIQNGIVEPTLGRDILTLHAIEKPALLRQLFWYVSRLPAQIVSYEKILGHLQGRGNSATLVHYAELLRLAFIIVPLSKFSQKAHRTKRSLPKWIIPNQALIDPSIKQEALRDFVFENLVGAHFLNLLFGSTDYELTYWREDNDEVDFILTKNNEPVLAIEVKSGRVRGVVSMDLLKRNGICCPLVVISQKNIEQFMSTLSVEEVTRLLPNQG